MRPVPHSIRVLIANSRYYFKAAMQIPTPVTQAARILLLLTAREHINTAIAEMRSHIHNTPLPKGLYKDHEAKLQEVSGPIIQLVDAGGGMLLEKAHLSGRELRTLLETSRYGVKGQLTELEPYFGTRWYTEEFERDLLNKIEWLEIEIQILDDLRKSQQVSDA